MLDAKAPEAYIAEQRLEAELAAYPRFIWPEGWDIARVYLHCSWRHAGLMHCLLPVGIDAVEIQATAQLLHIPQARWPDIVSGVRLMEGAARPIRQRRAIEAASR